MNASAWKSHGKRLDMLWKIIHVLAGALWEMHFPDMLIGVRRGCNLWLEFVCEQFRMLSWAQQNVQILKNMHSGKLWVPDIGTSDTEQGTVQEHELQLKSPFGK